MRAKEYFDIIVTKISDIEKTQIKQQAILDEHIRRTIANEEGLGVQKDILELLRKEFQDHSRDAVKWSVLGKIVTWAGAGVGLLTGVLKLMGKI